MSHNSLINKSIILRPTFDQAVTTSSGVIIPTLVSRGLINGFSLPVWNSDSEELKYRTRIIRRWDNVTDPILRVFGWLDTTETVGDCFKLQVEYECYNFDDSTTPIPETTNIISIETVIAINENLQYSPYTIEFALDDTALTYSCIFAARIRRIASVGTAIEGEFVATYSDIEFKTNKICGNFN